MVKVGKINSQARVIFIAIRREFGFFKTITAEYSYSGIISDYCFWSAAGINIQLGYFKTAAEFGIISKKAGSDIFTIIIEYPDKRAVSKNRFFNFFNRS